MKVQSNPTYYSNLRTNFQNRFRINQDSKSQSPIISRNNPNLYVYIYEDSNADVDIENRTYDSFTGLRDKQYLLAVLNKKIEQAQLLNKNLSVAMFDMDNFKSVNELLGYETGDDFIKFISDSIDKTAKANALSAYRFGGEEFVIVFENQPPETQKQIVDSILSNVNSNSYIKSKEREYENNANERLVQYSTSTKKITALMGLKEKKAIYEDLRKNCANEETKNDPYLLKNINDVDNELDSLYLHLLGDSLANENDNATRRFLCNIAKHYYSKQPISKEEQDSLDEYFRYKYDKSAELFQIKKWLKDFRENDGFSITGSAVSFKPEFIKNKSPMELIGITGEALKRGKEAHKGKSYYNSN